MKVDRKAGLVFEIDFPIMPLRALLFRQLPLGDDQYKPEDSANDLARAL